MSVCMQDFVLNDLFLELMRDITEEGFHRLNLKGNELFKKIGKRLEDPDMIPIVSFLAKYPDIVYLDLSNNKIGDCGLMTLMKIVKRGGGVKFLNLTNNKIRYKGIQTILEIGDDLPFRSLLLSGNKFGSKGGILLSRLLYKEIPLEVLDVSDTNQDVASLAYLFTGLMYSRGGKDNVRILDLSKPLPQFHHAMPSGHIAEFIGQVFQYNNGLQDFCLRGFRFDCHDIEIMLEGLMKNNTLTCLDLNSNNIGDDGVEYLCRYLKTGPVLSSLMIGANNIRDLGARTLAFTLPYSNLEVMDISHNKITDVGLSDIFYTLRKPKRVKCIFIWGNEMTHKCLLVLEKLILDNIIHWDGIDVKLYTADTKLHAARQYFNCDQMHRNVFNA